MASNEDVVEYPAPWPAIFEAEANPAPGFEDWCDRITDILRELTIRLEELERHG